MHSLIIGALTVVATSSMIGSGSAATAAGPTTHERGIVLDCTGTLGNRPVIANLYENRTFGNVLEVQVGEGAHEVGAGRKSAKPFLRGGSVHASIQLGSKQAVIAGTAHRVGRPIAVHEEMDDAGQHIVTDGFHRRLAPDLTFRLGRKSTVLVCADAFAYDLSVIKTPIE